MAAFTKSLFDLNLDYDPMDEDSVEVNGGYSGENEVESGNHLDLNEPLNNVEPSNHGEPLVEGVGESSGAPVNDAETSPGIIEQAINTLEAETLNSDAINEPCLGMSFGSCDEFAAFCFTYAMKKGFEIKTRTNTIMEEYKYAGVTRKRGGTQYYMLTRLRLACVKEGRKRSPKSQNTDCKCFVQANMANDVMVITNLCLDHNHDLYPELSRHTVSARSIGQYFKKRIMINERAGIPITKNFNAMVMEAGGHENLPFKHRDVRNLVNLERRIERIQGDAAALEAYFIELKQKDPDFFYAIKRDGKGMFENAFWADARCRALFRVFGDAITYDTTFLCNRYRLPFSPFIGVNHHGNSTCFGAAIITRENEESFVWIFERWLECMGKAPPVILTDQAQAIVNAIARVFPSSKHRLCLWHIMKNAVRNLGSFKFWKELAGDLKAAVHDSLTEFEFDNAWEAMVLKYGLDNNAWIKESYRIRRMWVPAYWWGTFCAGMSSTQRSEQANRFFKIRVSIETGLRNFMTQFEIAQQARVEEEKEHNFTTLTKPLAYDKSVLVEEIFSKVYTNEKFQEVLDETKALKHVNVEVTHRLGTCTLFRADEKVTEPIWKRGRQSFDVKLDVNADDYSCSCQKFEFRGILCRHIIKCVEYEDIKVIPDTYILDRWRKDIVRGYETIKVGNYDPAEIARVKRSMDADIRYEYIKKLAFHDDKNTDIFEKHLTELEKELEESMGVETAKSIKVGSVSSKVFGRRRLQPRESNMRHIARNLPPPTDGQIKDPVDRRGTGRAPKPRQNQTPRKRKAPTTDNAQSPSSKQMSRLSNSFNENCTQ